MKATKILLLGLSVVIVSGLIMFQLSHAEIYKWVDEKGTVNFTEDPTTIPEKYQGKAQSRDIPESPEKKAPLTSKGTHYNYPPQRQLSVPKQFNKDEQECGLGEYETNVFMMRYLGGGRSPLAPQCRDILKKCCNYSHREFADLVDKYAKNPKWEVIPGKIPGLLRMYCGQTEPDISSESRITSEEERRTRKKQEDEEEEVRRKKQEEDRNPRSGEFLPRSGSGVFNPRTGEYYPPSGPNAYINLRTGEIYPKSGSGAIKP